MNLIIDQGNTTTKITLFDKAQIFKHFIENKFSFAKIQKYINKSNKCIYSTVIEPDHEEIKNIQNKFSKFIFLNHSTALPIEVIYKSRETLGNDRIAGAAGAHHLYPENNVLIIDAGTAITYDLKTADGKYIGGNISPGLSMRFKALNDYTGKLPLVAKKEKFDDFGDNTENAIVSGIQNGMIYEIEQTIQKAENKFNNLIVIITGGDAVFFDNNIKKSIFVVQNLVAIGLNTILKYNAD